MAHLRRPIHVELFFQQRLHSFHFIIHLSDFLNHRGALNATSTALAHEHLIVDLQRVCQCRICGPNVFITLLIVFLQPQLT